MLMAVAHSIINCTNKQGLLCHTSQDEEVFCLHIGATRLLGVLR